ncbi:hypothetical protein S40288_00824 [Stachybotrys chartarum IBT 40288]|nr:hypothetical protein S40288_00824 [Stachybotrys chartarum IBT 40288]
MFYSHEILSNSQYGVATIWLVATVSKTTQRRVTRKAIQEVDVPRACGKILDPGAPLALRLQGSLLYGVSRVFAHQCNYVLNDAEKTQSDMITFFQVLKQSDPDPQAGKTKRSRITLEDDPSFDPFAVLPTLDLIKSRHELVFLQSQLSSNKTSQMTPLGGLSQSTLSSGRAASLLRFDLPPSSHSAGSRQILSDLDHRGSPLSKQMLARDSMADFKPFEEDDFNPLSHLLEFDGHGNLIETEEPQLPELLSQDLNAQLLAEAGKILGGNEQAVFIGDEDAFLHRLQENTLPDAEPFALPTATPAAETADNQDPESMAGVRTATAKNAPRVRPRKIPILRDESLLVPRQELRSWDTGYLANMQATRKGPARCTLAQARKNATSYIYRNGIAMVGAVQEVFHVSHPLASQFAGYGLIATLQGRQVDVSEGEARRARRRSSSEAFEEEEDERRVKQRVEEAPEIGRARPEEPSQHPLLGDDSLPELGMDPAAAMDERHSSMMPWNRPPSVAPGSSVPGSARKGIVDPSPLHGRERGIQPLQRHSDAAFPSSDFGPLCSQGSMDLGELDLAPERDTQASHGRLDTASQEFFAYARDHAGSIGGMQANIHSRSVAAEAFMHVLSLATKKAIAVTQEGIEEMVPFGAIRIGFTKPEDELMEGAEE